MAYAAQNKIEPQGYCAAIWHDPEYKERDVDGEALLELPASVSGNERIRVKALPAIAQAAVIIHRGSYSALNQVCGALMNWIKEGGYTIVGPNREVYLHWSSRSPLVYVKAIKFYRQLQMKSQRRPDCSKLSKRPYIK